MITTSFDFPNYTITQCLGSVRGISVRSPGFFGSISASFQSITSGDIPRLTKLCEETRNFAFKSLIEHAEELGANAIIGLRFDANEIGGDATEILAYGTAVITKKN